MRRIALTSLLAIALITMSFAQQAPKAQGMKMKMMQMHQEDSFTPEQQATLKAKKLTLALELNDKQKSELTKLFKEEAAMMQKHHNKMKALKEEGKKVDRYDMMNRHLDLKIDQQRKIKNILSEDQYTKWSKMKMHMGSNKAPKGKAMMHKKMMEKKAHAGKMKGMHSKMKGKDHQCDENCKMHKEKKEL